MKKRLLTLLLIGAVAIGTLAFAGCSLITGGFGETGTDTETTNPSDKEPETPSERYYTVTLYAQGGKFVAEDAELDKNATISFNGKILTLIGQSKDRFKEPLTPERKNYLFTGWAIDEQSDKTWNFETDELNSDISLYAVWEETCEFALSESGDYYRVKGPGSFSGEVKIPETYNGKPVKEIAAGAFENKAGLTSITIPNGIESIGDIAFKYCGKLTSITIPESVTSIGLSAFSGCYSLETVYWNAVSCTSEGDFLDNTLINIIIGENVTALPSDAFYGCFRLESITVDENNAYYKSENNCLLTADGKTLILGCKNSIIPDGVTDIGSNAFYYCSDLKSVTIPESVTSIGYIAFLKCSSLESISYTGNIASWCEISGLSYLLGNESKLYINGEEIKGDITIPDGVTSISDYAFYCCSGLTSVIIPDSVTSIGKSVFRGCSGLTSAPIPDSVSSIGDMAFKNCSGLTSMTVPDSVTSIGDSVFNGCSSLKTITLPFVGDSVKTSTDLHQYPFGYAFGRYNYSGGVATKQTYYGLNLYYAESDTFYIPETLRNVTITGGNLLAYAFHNCNGITSVTVAERVTKVGLYAFLNCSVLTIYCEAENEQESWNAKWNFSNRPVVWNCKENNVADDGYVYHNIDDVYYKLKDGKATVCKQSPFVSGDIILPKTVDYDEITYNVTSISEGAFRDCAKLTSITISDSITSIGNSAFSGCSGLTDLTIGKYVKDIGSNAFEGCSKLTSLTIPSSVTSIGDYAFKGCGGLKSITVSGSNKNYIGKNNCLLTADGKTLILGCEKSVVPAGVESIGDYAFYGCYYLSRIDLPDSISFIGNYAFYGCHELYRVVIRKPPKDIGLRSIGDYAFANCGGGRTVNLYYTGSGFEWWAVDRGTDWDKDTFIVDQCNYTG